MQSAPQYPSAPSPATPGASHTPGSLTSMMMLLIVSLLLIQPFFGVAYGLQTLKALTAIAPDAVLASGIAMALGVIAAGLSILAGVMMIVWRKPLTRRVLLAAIWVGGPLLTVTLQMFLLGWLGRPWTDILEGNMASSNTRMLVYAGVITLYVVYSRGMRARFNAPVRM
ncbi:hypothetical protein ACILG0_18035 [Pseudomonadota bacterium AL_CKDN230030165-1A_HGKHYDSX7]